MGRRYGAPATPAATTAPVLTKPTPTATGGNRGKQGSKPTCCMTSKRSERCDASGDIRVDGNRSAIYVTGIDKEWKTKPYARCHDPVAMAHVREYTLRPLPEVRARC